MERAYTIKEIDALRETVEQRIMWGTTDWRSPRRRNSYECMPNEHTVKVEEQTRTAMLAGLTADDIIKEDLGLPWDFMRRDQVIWFLRYDDSGRQQPIDISDSRMSYIQGHILIAEEKSYKERMGRQ